MAAVDQPATGYPRASTCAQRMLVPSTYSGYEQFASQLETALTSPMEFGHY